MGYIWVQAVRMGQNLRVAVGHVGKEEWQGQVEIQASESNSHTNLAKGIIGEERWVVERAADS